MQTQSPGPVCPYCSNPAQLVTGEAVYPHLAHLHALNYWVCSPCDARVGCHKKGAWTWGNGCKVVSDGTLAMGVLSNPELRLAKQQAHGAFDPLWQDGTMTRHEAYAWLSHESNLDIEHIGNCTIAQCQLVCELSLRKRISFDNEPLRQPDSLASVERLHQLTKRFDKTK